MSEETIKRYKRDYKKELLTYTFPEDYYDIVLNSNFRKNMLVNERRNINIIKNTPKEFYLFEGNFIYYKVLRELNEHINEWIKIYAEKVKFVNDINIIYDIYMEILNYINKEISVFVNDCRNKYEISYPIVIDTSVKNYIDILMGRKLKIANTLRVILESEFNLYYEEYNKEILDLYNYYQGKILSIEDENIELYNEFRSKVTNAINKPKALIKEK